MEQNKKNIEKLAKANELQDSIGDLETAIATFEDLSNEQKNKEIIYFSIEKEHFEMSKVFFIEFAELYLKNQKEEHKKAIIEFNSLFAK